MIRRAPTTWSRRPVVAALAVLAATALLAGCGGDDEPVTVTTAGGTTEEVVVASSDGDFDPHGIFQRTAPGVVTVISIFGSGDPLDILSGGGGAGQGSGFVVNDNGEIVTNAHVITTGGQANGGGPVREAQQVYVDFADGNRVRAEIVGVDPFSDVGLLRVEPNGLDLKPLKLAEPGGLAVGQPVVAIGSPFAEEQSLSVGVISALDRSIESLTQFRIENAIQTDAAINPGNSGGPLLSAKSAVIGINQQIRSSSGTNSGVGFAIPASAIHFALEQLREDGEVEYAFIGVTTQALYPQLADELDINADSGALVSEVVEGGPADDAGIRGGDREIRFQGFPVTAGGDVILAVEGHQLSDDRDLSELVGLRRPGETVTLEILRDGDRMEVEVKLGKRPGT